MKVLVVMGSPRKGNTYRSVRKIEEIMRSRGDVEFEYLMLNDVNQSPCSGCLVCFGKGEEYCPLKDDAPAIEKKMHESDGVIFATPVYGMNVSAQMKIFIDRHSYIFHRPRFFDKKALLLSTTGVIGHREVLDYLQLVAGSWGFEISHKVGIITREPLPAETELENEKKLQAAANVFYSALLNKKRWTPGLKDLTMFRVQKAIFKNLADFSPADYNYWKEKGWLRPEAKYYTDVPINPFYNAVSWISEQILKRKMGKEILENQK
ncbi:flavodoxin family protein [Methanolobus sediminis]|uniref:Flavodoxin family protein n=1 Tax=Methanolobus sediminis TaxID=3072978 RepID=A0AA51YLQ9_9EURY|nr:flavodoxin family protein [Methanolobus sediminis]WMW25167.1 flavodoxin family protein [Methanolobus sediminis]